MKPTLDVAGLRVPTYSLWYFGSFAVFLAIGALLLARRGEDRGAAVDLAVLLGLAYTVGARVLAAVVGREWQLFTDPGSRLEGTLWGGQLAFGIALFAYVAASRSRWPALGDATAVAWAVATVLHKVGCFFAGCCEGAPSELPWAVAFPRGSASRLHELPVQPTQLYDAAAALLLAIGLGFAFARGVGRGRLLLWWGLGFAATRFATEWTRGAPRFAFAGVNAAMLPELAVVAVTVALLVRPAAWDRLHARAERRFAERAISPNAVAPRARVSVAGVGDAVCAAAIALVVLRAVDDLAMAAIAGTAYFVLSHAAWGTAPLARALGLTAVDASGARAGLARRALRGLVEAASALTLLGLLRPWLDGASRTTGDAVTRTFTARR